MIQEYDVIVIGSGSGEIIVEGGLAHDLKVAFIEKGRLGGTCLNVGCIPSKLLLFPANRIMEIQEAGKLGIQADIKEIDFKAIMKRMHTTIAKDQDLSKEKMREIPNLDFYDVQAQFVDEYMLQVGNDMIRGKKIIIASGARPRLPPIKNLEDIDYLTNETLLELNEKPESLIIIGGGYIAAEYAHFFSAMGTRVTLLQRGERLLKEEEPEISEILRKEMAQRIDIYMNMEAVEAKKIYGGCKIVAKDLVTGKLSHFQAEKTLLAAGRESKADLLRVGKTGVDTDERSFIKVNEYLETSKAFIWALGDAPGKKMFKHAANREAAIVLDNAVHGTRRKINFNLIPHAVFTYPEIASVGLKESEAKHLYDILVGRARYTDVARGKAMEEENGLVKAIVEKESGKILGFHIIGPDASILIQEVINAMSLGGTALPIFEGMHIHPALSEVIQAALANLEEPS